MKPPIQALPYCTLLVLLANAAFADQDCRSTATKNEAELSQRIGQLRDEFSPFLRSLPQLMDVRKQTSLSGNWWFRYEVRDASKGMMLPRAPDWFGQEFDSANWESTTVPQWRYRRGKNGTVLGGKDVFGWGERGEHSNIVWYRRQFAAGPPSPDKRLWLCFDAVDWEAEVYLNSELLGRHRVRYEPFRYDITEKVKPSNTLAVRIVDGRVFGEPHAFWTPLPDARAEDQIYVRDAGKSLKGILPIGYHGGNGFGILRDVRLEQTGPVLVSRVFARNDLSGGKARIDVELDSQAACNATLKVELLPENFDKGRAYEKALACKLIKGAERLSIAIPMPGAATWSPESPNLYRCRVTAIPDKAATDSKDVLFGCRSFGIVSKQNPSKGLPEGIFLLNGKPIYLRGTNIHGLNAYWYWHQNDKLLHALLMLKAANFNSVRVCQHTQFPEVRELLDRMGILSEQEQGSGYRHQKSGLEPKIMAQLLHTATVLARETYNNPGVVLLTFGNECNFDATKLVKTVLAVDPQRIVKPISGRLSHGGRGNPLLNEDWLWAHVVDDTHTYAGWYGQRDNAPWTRAYVRPAQRLLLVGEYGAEALDAYETMRDHYPKNIKPPAANTDTLWAASQVKKADAAQIYGYGHAPRNLGEYIEASQNYQEALLADSTIGFRISPRCLSGYFQFHFMDVTPAFWPKSIVSFDHQPKKAYFQMAQINQPVVALPQFLGKRPEKMALWLCNDLPRDFSNTTVHWTVRAGGKTLVKGRKHVDIRALDATQGPVVDLTTATRDHRLCEIKLALEDAKGAPLSEYRRTLRCMPHTSPSECKHSRRCRAVCRLCRAAWFRYRRNQP